MSHGIDRRQRRGAAPDVRRRATAAWGGAPKFPPALHARVPAGGGRAASWPWRRCERWPPAGSTTRSAAALPATRSTRPGPSPTSRRCSTTTRCSPAHTCTAGRFPASRGYARSASETLDFALRELRGPGGGFCAALDADSEGVEGKFYVWSVAELREVLGRARGRGDRLLRRQRAGQLRRRDERSGGARAAARARCRRSAQRLLEARSERVRPALDDKRLTAWNALMISAFADAGAVLERDDYLDAARALRGVRARIDAHRRMVGCCAPGRTAGARRISPATWRITPTCCRRCWSSTRQPSRSAGTSRRSRSPTRCSSTSPIPAAAASSRPPRDQPHLVARVKDMQDAPIPSGNSAAALGLLRLARLSGDTRYERDAGGVVELYGPLAARHPSAFGHLLQAIDFQLAPAREVAIVAPGGEDDGAEVGRALSRVVRQRFRPHEVLAGGWGIGRAQCRCSRVGGPSTDGLPHTCVSASPARRRSRMLRPFSCAPVAIVVCLSG